MIERTCLTCGKIFYVRPCVVLANRGKYCSHECYNASIIKSKVECKCLTCGNIFTVFPYVIRNGGGKYCSQKCNNGSRSKRIKHVCKMCGKIFFAVPNKDGSTKRKYCSIDCANKSFSKPHVIIKCENCGKEFSVLSKDIQNGKKYCSTKCYHEAQINRVTRICLTCGREFYMRFRDLGREDKGKYCCKECFKNRKLTTKVNLSCKYCGKIFALLPNAIMSGLGKYCSRDCLNKAKIKPRVDCICQTCGKKFTVFPCISKIGMGKYCSKQCQYNARIGFQPSEKTRIKLKESFVGGFWYGNVIYNDIEYYCEKFNNGFRVHARAFWNYTCIECGKRENGRKHIVHHVFYVKKACCMKTDDGMYHTNLNARDHKNHDYIIGDNPNYFVVLCMSCHGKTNGSFKIRESFADKYRKLIDEEYEGKSYYTEEEFRNLNQLPR